MLSQTRTATSPGSNDPGTVRRTVLAGGVSSDIWIEHSPQGDYVVKRALGKLKVQADWLSDPARSSIEVRGLRAMAELLGQAHVPEVLWVDEARHQFAMALIAPHFGNWKQQLLDGHVDLATASAAGRLLGELHARSSGNAEIAIQFASTKTFVELRIQPYFERVAQRNPALACAISDIVGHLLSTRIALVHGDFSPKNLLVAGSDVVIVDCEVAHWGDARFDIAFCVAHLLLKSFRRTTSSALLLSATLAFLSAYRRSGLDVLDREFTRQLGCLLLARLHGDSPVDYLDDLDIDAIAQFAVELVVRPPLFAANDLVAAAVSIA
jgi:tRNA A-37 threonylcarbamoyl transferase component Bud32